LHGGFLWIVVDRLDKGFEVVNLFVSGCRAAVPAVRNGPSPPEAFGRFVVPPPPAALD
jgi:hypothetical protein